MIATDWRQYKTTPGDYEDGRLKTLKGSIKPCRSEYQLFRENSGLLEIKPLKPQKKGEKSGSCRNVIEAWAERAAIKEFCGGISREQAEVEAAMEFQLLEHLEALRKMAK